MITNTLDAVNTILDCVNELPVNTLSSGLIEADQALRTLQEVDRETQAQGWYFNFEKNYELMPDTEGYILLPINCLSIDNAYLQPEGLVQRGDKLYDIVKHTYKIKKKVVVNLTVLLLFEELPEVAKRYITIKAARIRQDRSLADTTLHQFQQIDEMIALNNLFAAEREINKYNIFDNYSGMELLDRNPYTAPARV